MPNVSVDPATLDGDDLIQWYRRPPWKVDQERKAAAAKTYADFFGGTSSLLPDPRFTDAAVSVGSPGASSTQISNLSSMSMLSGRLPEQQSVSALPSGLEGRAGGFRLWPQDGFLSGLRSWAVPDPDARTAKSVAATAPGWPQVGPDPVKVDVFPRGADGKLHPASGWRTTGPFDFGTWTQEFDKNGIVEDLAHIADGVLSVEGVKAAGNAVLDALGPNIRRSIERGIFGPGQYHHPIPKFMGGPMKQDMPDLAPPIHIAFHKDLTTALKQAGLPPVGGETGSTIVWKTLFDKSSAKKELAHRVLRWVTRNFDVERGTSITPHLDKALEASKPQVPPAK